MEVTVIQSRALEYLLCKLRDVNLGQREFVHYGDRAMRILAEEALCRLPTIVKKEMRTPCGVIEGLVEDGDVKLCVVSIVRSGDILQEAVRQISPGVKLGKILIQRDENHVDKVPIFLYDKYPKDIDSCFVILTDPMLATGGSATLAIKMLLDKGVKEANILFLNLICAPEGLEVLKNNFPKIQVVTGAIDKCLNSEKFIVPGLGDYGDRYSGTG
ncbi:uracil phosphoribosyltransferase [Lepeophtheirus salmonis]|uniref:uracil phosphoribosyltransferase n=1 Tax=Lepeophtheirus salmonis TaxID=72036 RepID=A0A0K2U0T7_LEPSM|nr:uracil phosphoribosyltransferase-like [Lepeophtheirus salmonis]